MFILLRRERAEASMEGTGQRSMGIPTVATPTPVPPSQASRCPSVPAFEWVGAEAPLSPPQRTCPIQRKYSPRTSPNGTPMTSWTKLKALSQRTHRVPWSGGATGPGGGWPQGPSPSLPQLLSSAGHGGVGGLGTPKAPLVRVTASVLWAWGCPAAPPLTAPTASVLQTVYTARVPPSSGWPPVWSS